MIVGIDLGTTNSLIAVWRDGTPFIVPNVFGEALTPSCISVDDDDSMLVGKAAKERLFTHPARTAAVFKRYMGTDRRIELGKRSFRPEELSSLILRSLKADAEAFLGQPVERAIITVPAYFSDAQRKATRIAGQLAGLKVERLVNEPTAAALAYGIQERGRETKFLVFDLGGGTFDVSILELFEGVMEVRASAGDNFLGGEDFADVLCNVFLAEAAAGKARSSLSPQEEQRLRGHAEQAKRRLTETERVEMLMPIDGQPASLEITQERFQALVEPLLARLRAPVERALHDARIRVSELDNVVLAGGATRMPVVRKLVSRMFGRLPASHLNPDEVVARGAAVMAGLEMRDIALSEVVMTDVCPYTLGIEIARQMDANQVFQGHYLPIIERNSAVPVSRVEKVFTIVDNQRGLRVKVYQGEARMVKDNILLGDLHINVSPKPAGEVSADVRFTYDVSGLLEVEATLMTGETHRLVIESNAGVMSASAVTRRLAELAKLKIHPREKMENRELFARADRLYEQSLGGLREHIAQQVTRFQGVLETQRDGDIARAREELDRMLTQIEMEFNT